MNGSGASKSHQNAILVCRRARHVLAHCLVVPRINRIWSAGQAQLTPAIRYQDFGTTESQSVQMVTEQSSDILVTAPKSAARLFICAKPRRSISLPRSRPRPPNSAQTRPLTVGGRGRSFSILGGRRGRHGQFEVGRAGQGGGLTFRAPACISCCWAPVGSMTCSELLVSKRDRKRFETVYHTYVEGFFPGKSVLRNYAGPQYLQ